MSSLEVLLLFSKAAKRVRKTSFFRQVLLCGNRNVLKSQVCFDVQIYHLLFYIWLEHYSIDNSYCQEQPLVIGIGVFNIWLEHYSIDNSYCQEQPLVELVFLISG